MKKKMVKVTLNGSGQALILDYTEFHIGCLVKWMKYKDKIKIEALKSEYYVKKTQSIDGQDEYVDVIKIKTLGEFGNLIVPGSGQVFELELIEMDEKEIAALREFKGW